MIKTNPTSSVVIPSDNETKLTAGQVLYQEKYDLLPFKDANRRYLILSSQRTGSNYLCRRLCNVKGRFGLPSEYLHPKAIQAMTPRLVDKPVNNGQIALGKYMRLVERARTSEDGWFGIKVQPAQLLVAVGRQEKTLLQFVQSFDRIVLMTRRDKLGQAVSGAIAQSTGKWFNDGAEPIIDDARIPSLFPAIASNLARYVEEERMILNIGKVIAKPLLRIEYEEIEQDDQAAFINLVDFLSAGADVTLDESGGVDIPEKPPGDFAQAVRGRFLKFIEGVR